ncbi:MAG: peptidoglycan DD-metalloendopeptidase family protein [Gammaproteobacteria bacterium]|jgi:lipoprotein NlpD|nr:peptidoglycan DD-metalloendopeptidase family protein [Gammaproteobacteria bacterium]
MAKYWASALTIGFLLGGCSSSYAPAPVDEVASARVKKPTITARTYQVKKGDTLFSIAFRAGMDYRSLAKLNRIPEPFTIYVGQVLVVAEDSSYQTVMRGPSNQSKTANANYSNPVNSATSSKQAKVVASSNKSRYGQSQQDKDPEKPKNTAFNAKSGQWLWPVKGPILAKFSQQEHGNKGLDIGGALGTPIKAAAAGQVVYAGNALRGYGNLIIIRHNDDFLSAYAHNHRLLVKERDTVTAGQLIAEMGNTDAERIQLHFEIRFRGRSVDPLQYLK